MKNSGKQLDKRYIALVLLALTLVLAACTGVRGAQGGTGVAFDGDRLFVGTKEGQVRAINVNATNAELGSTLWNFDLQGEEDLRTLYGEPVVVGNTVFVGGYDFFLYALSASDGTLKGSELIGSRIVASPAVVDNTLIVGDSVGNVFAFDFAIDLINNITFIKKWEFVADNRVWSTPAVVDGIVYFGSLDHNFYALDLDDGSLIWKFFTEGAISSPPLVFNGRVYFGSFDKIFYALDAKSGEEVWSFDGAGNWYWAKAVTDGSTIYAPSLDNNLYALDIDTGELKWKLETEGPIAGSPAIVDGDKIAVPSDDGRLRIAMLSTGTEMGFCNIGERLRTPIVERDGIIYFGVRKDSSIRALRIKSDGNPDEVWVHFTNEDDPIKRGRSPDC